MSTLFEKSVLYKYTYYINKRDTDILDFIHEIFETMTPSYLYTLLASTSSTHHGKGELLIDHIDQCCYIMAHKVWVQMDKYWDYRTKDLALTGMLIHDNWRCGYPGSESRYTAEIIKRRGYPEELLNTLMTSSDHAIIGGNILDIQLATYPDKYPEDFKVIADCVRYHYGPWGPKIDMDEYPYTSPVIQVHNVDLHQTANSEMRSKL
jgi:hypothetical protein